MDLKYQCGCPGRGLCEKGCHTGNYSALNTFDYLADVPGNDQVTDLVEVQFKNTRKGYYRNVNRLPLVKGDIVAVESSPGHDIGIVSLTGKLVTLQMKKANLKKDEEIRNIYRKARPSDMEKYEESKAREHQTMIESRRIAKDLGLEMKIGDVEYQGDGNKATFYYIADGRVDFRQLIKVLAEAFHVRIEMKQIGARQEAGRIGGFGPCGRELCCATWIKNFVSVGTGAARVQDLSLNPQKLAGQCAKLKCCINYEVDQYVEASKKIPPRDVVLQTADGDYYFFKADMLAGTVTFSTDKRIAANLTTISTDRIQEIMSQNSKGEKVERLSLDAPKIDSKPVDLATQEDLERFDKKKKKKRRKRSQSRNAESRRADGKTAERENTPTRGGDRSKESGKGRQGEHRRREKGDGHPRRDRGPRRSGNNNRKGKPTDKPAGKQAEDNRKE